MAKISEWKSNLAVMDDVDLAKVQKALDILKNWELCEREYAEMKILRSLVDHEITLRTDRWNLQYLMDRFRRR